MSHTTRSKTRTAFLNVFKMVRKSTTGEVNFQAVNKVCYKMYNVLNAEIIMIKIEIEAEYFNLL